MQNQPVVRVEQEFFRDEFHQFVFHFADVFAGREFGAVGHAEYVGVHGHHGLPECGVEHDVGRFAAHAGQGFQFFARAGNFAAVLLHQNFAGFDDVFGLGFVKPDSAGVLHNALQPEVEHGLGRVGHGKEFGGGFVHAHVSGLCGQQNGNQEFERGAELQFGGGVRVGFAPTFKHFGADVLVHKAGAGCFLGFGGCVNQVSGAAACVIVVRRILFLWPTAALPIWALRQIPPCAFVPANRRRCRKRTANPSRPSA